MQRRNILKIIAIITMTLDHLGEFLFPDLLALRIIGRIAFPIAAYQIAVGYKYTSNLKKYALRLIILAWVTQVPYNFIMGPKLNPAFTLLFGLIAIILWNWNKAGKVLALVLCVAGVAMPLSYHAYGIFMVFIFEAFSHLSTYRTVMIFIALNYVFYVSHEDDGLPIQVFSILALPFIYLIPDADKKEIRVPKIFENKMFYYIYYPAHITVIYLISRLV
ncbi:MAG: hypothetical protein IJS35_02000 [Firmicutes bacterium]|nr:hypothetical protein [Bacillota bacterium]